MRKDNSGATSAESIKTCSRCGLDKPISEFTRDKYRPDGHRNYCRRCAAEYVKALGKPARDKIWRAANKDRLAEQGREWRAKNAVALREKKKAYHVATRAERSARTKQDRKDNPEKYNNDVTRAKSSAKRRLAHSKFTDKLYRATLEAQNHLCAICGCDLKSLSPHRVHADHCHASGVPRGVLCGNCNQAIGLMKDSPDRLRAAAEYLEQHSTLREIA